VTTIHSVQVVHRRPDPHSWLALLLAVGVGLLFGVRHDGGAPHAGMGASYEQIEQFHCQEGAALLADCCPGFDAASVDCTWESGSGEGCEGGHYPDIGTYDYECLSQISCAELRHRGICTTRQYTAACD
jgi:hypothetical protein